MMDTNPQLWLQCAVHFSCSQTSLKEVLLTGSVPPRSRSALIHHFFKLNTGRWETTHKHTRLYAANRS